jgi:hypothetical protein
LLCDAVFAVVQLEFVHVFTTNAMGNKNQSEGDVSHLNVTCMSHSTTPQKCPPARGHVTASAPDAYPT